jgi:hypothetical protein
MFDIIQHKSNSQTTDRPSSVCQSHHVPHEGKKTVQKPFLVRDNLEKVINSALTRIVSSQTQILSQFFPL